MKCVVLCGGGTGGHIYPNLALYDDLKPFRRVCYVGCSGGMEEELCGGLGIEFFGISAPKFRRSFTLKNLQLPFALSKSVKETKVLLQKLNPAVIFSKGGYVSLPVCLAGLSLGIPVLSHESDLSLGLANKIAYKKGSTLLTAFAPTMAGKKRVLHVGAPLRKGLFTDVKMINQSVKSNGDTLQKLLVIGGSQGAKAINDAVIENLPELCTQFEITHITGRGKMPSHDDLARMFAHLRPIALATMLERYHPFEYASDMGKIYRSTDIAISRGGANALFELLQFEIPTLVIPLEKGSRGDQVENAEYFSREKLCHTLGENHTFALVESLNNLCENSHKIKQNISHRKIQESFDGRANIVKLILSH